MDCTGSTSRSVTRALATVAFLALATTACSLSTGPTNQPTVAHIIVTGTASESLELMVSTNFYETQDPTTGAINQVFNTSDTKQIDVPYDARVQLTDQGSIAVHLKNTSSTDVTVRLQVGLDNGQGYDNTATLAQGKELSYVFVYTASAFG